MQCDNIWGDFEDSLAHLNVGAMLDMTDMWLDEFDAYDADAQAADYFMAIDAAMSPVYTITNDLPRRFRSWVEKLTVDKSRPLLSCLSPKAQYITFNYTDFLESLYGVPRDHIRYIHGCRAKRKGEPKDKLILGHVPDVDYLDGYVPNQAFVPQENWKAAMVEMAQEQAMANWVEHYEETFTKRTSDIIRSNLDFFEKAKDFEEIYVIGHSLSQVDYPYFAEIAKRNADKAVWHIGYHSLQDMKRLQELVKALRLTQVKVFRI